MATFFQTWPSAWRSMGTQIVALDSIMSRPLPQVTRPPPNLPQESAMAFIMLSQLALVNLNVNLRSVSAKTSVVSGLNPLEWLESTQPA
jgi:hypothetical protein